MTNEEKLQELEKKVNNLKAEKIRAEEQLKHLRQQKDEVIDKLKQMGVNPNDLANYISQLEREINTQITSIENQIPK